MFLSSDPATLSLPSLKCGGICSDSLKSDQDLLSSFVRIAQIQQYLIRSDLVLLKSDYSWLD